MEVDTPWLKQKLGILVLIKTGPVAKLLSWQQHNRCYLVSFVMYVSGAKFDECHSNISLEILFIQYFTVLVAQLMTSSL